MPYRLIKKEGAARRGEFQTVHGTVQTPAFQNVATAAAIKGGLSAHDLKEIRAQVMLCIISTCVPVIRSLPIWAACTSLPAGTARS